MLPLAITRDAKELWSSKETMRARPPGPRESREAFGLQGICEVSNCGFSDANFVARFEDFGPFSPTREIKTYCKILQVRIRGMWFAEGYHHYHHRSLCKERQCPQVYARFTALGCATAQLGLPFELHTHAHRKITTCYTSLLGPLTGLTVCIG